MTYAYTNISEAGHNGAIDYEEGETLVPASGAALKVRYRVHHDTSYAFQSWARAEVWSPVTLSWNEVETYHFGQWAEFTTPEAPFTPFTEGGWAAVAELKARARAVLEAGS